MNDISMAIRVSPVVGRNLLGVVVPMFLCFSLGFVVGITCNAKFPNFFYLPFVPPLLPSASMWSPSPSPPPLLPPPVPSPPLHSALQPPPPPPPPSPPPPTPSIASVVQSSKVELMIGSLSSVKSNNMTDEELLIWWASMSPKVRATPYHRVPKVAFLFLARGDLPLRPLWEKFFQGHEALYSIYVHADPSYTGSPPEDSVFYDRMIRSQNTSWGDVTLVDAARRLVANALLDLGNLRLFALLSESCIHVGFGNLQFALLDFTTVYALLTGSDASFVDSFDNHDGEVRYSPFFGQRAAGSGGGNITLSQWRKGAQWFEMDRALAVEFVSDDTYFPAFREYCASHSYVCFAEEHYLPTLVSVVGWTRNANRTLTYTDWRGGGSHPRTHGAGDATEALIREIRASGAGGFGPVKNCTANNDGASGGICYLFARKFAPDTLEPLLRLAPKVMGFG